VSTFNDIFQKELMVRRAQKIFPPAEKFPGADKNISIDELSEEALLNEKYGPQQVQSLLGFIVDYPLYLQMEDAEAEVRALHHLDRLNSHRGS